MDAGTRAMGIAVLLLTFGIAGCDLTGEHDDFDFSFTADENRAELVRAYASMVDSWGRYNLSIGQRRYAMARAALTEAQARGQHARVDALQRLMKQMDLDLQRLNQEWQWKREQSANLNSAWRRFEAFVRTGTLNGEIDKGFAYFKAMNLDGYLGVIGNPLTPGATDPHNFRIRNSRVRVLKPCTARTAGELFNYLRDRNDKGALQYSYSVNPDSLAYIDLLTALRGFISVQKVQETQTRIEEQFRASQQAHFDIWKLDQMNMNFWAPAALP